VRPTCCLLALLFALTATARQPKRPKGLKPFARIFEGTVLEYRAPKGNTVR
jgi:hypothetical protein